MKFLTSYIVLIFFPIISFSQTQIGFKAGYIYYWFTKPEKGHFYADYDYSHNAYSVSVMVRQRIPKSFLNLGLEIEYANRSFSVKSGWGGLGSGRKANFSYTIGNLYLHIQPQFTFGKKFQFYFYPGIYFGTLINSNLTGSLSYWQMGNPSSSETEILNGSAVGYYPTFEFGIYPGIGFEFPLYKNLDFIFEYSFTMNFLPIGKSWGGYDVKMLNMNFEIGAVYNLYQNKKEKQ